MSKLQPEKYYEACITYNIIVELNRMGKKVYPYSISQRQEKGEGFDFGYCINKNSFLIQYKSPELFKEIENGEKIYRWEIDREQLSVLNRYKGNVPAYYALPAFENIFDWYSGIRKTYFIDSKRLENLFDKMTKTSILRSDCNALKTWDDLREKFRKDSYNYAVSALEESMSEIWNVDEEIDGLWIYMVEVE